MQILQQLHEILGQPLRQVPDIAAYLRDHYPPSYREVVDEAQEMARSYHARTAFTDAEGNLIGLNLYQCELTDKQADALLALDLPRLRVLNLARNPLSRFALSARMPALEIVAINHNEQLHTLRCEDGLAALRRLDASFCALRQFRVPASYTGLEFLRLDGNKALEEVRFDGPCPRLQVLMLRGGALKAFRLPAGFDALAHLYLNQNQIGTLELAGALGELRTLQLRKNQLRDFPEPYLRLLPQLEALYLGDNPLPEELRAKIERREYRDHLPLIRHHFQQLGIGRPRPNNECKVLLIGNGKAGKSAVVNRIVNNDFDPDWNSTHGITLLRHPMDPYVLNFWDFGGQDMYHSTHRLFLQDNAVYLLVWCQDTEDNPSTVHEIQQADGTVVSRTYKNHQLRYWLEYAHSRGKGSPLLLVQTKTGTDPQRSKQELLDDYQEAFSPPPAEFQVESSWPDAFDNGYGKLLKALSESVAHIKRGSPDLAQPLYDIRAWLRAQQEAGVKTLPYADYEAKARELGVLDPRLELETWLFKSGVVYYRRGRFNDQIILDQGWAIQAIYTLFDRSQGVPWEIEKRKGVFSGAFVQALWSKNYPDQETHELFISFMKSCDLCFEVETGKKHPSFSERLFMAPQLLDEERPELIEDFWENREKGVARFSHRFLHEGIIHSFIAKTAYLTSRREVWRQGIQISEGEGPDKQTACLEADSTGISVRYTPNARPLLAKIRHLLKELLGDQITEQDSSGRKIALPEAPTRSLLLDPAAEDMAELILQKGPEADKAGQGQRFEEGEGKTMLTSPEDRDVLANQVADMVAEKIISQITAGVFVSPISTAPPKRILFVAANPLETGRLQLDFEHERLVNEFQLGKAREQFEFLPPKLAISVSQFLRIEDDAPYIIHFSGHGDHEGIYIQDGQNTSEPASNEFLDDFFKDMAGVTELVILNSCLSATQAHIISKYITYVVGCEKVLEDDLAIAFSSGLYNGLGEGNDVMKALKRGRRAVIQKDPKAKDLYQVWHKGQKLDW